MTRKLALASVRRGETRAGKPILELILSYNLNDNSIKDKADDRYGVAPFTEAIANGILRVKDPFGTTIALNGTWGSGKSSAINLIKSALARIDGADVIVTEFKVWWYRGEEALALAFFKELNDALRKEYGLSLKSLCLS